MFVRLDNGWSGHLYLFSGEPVPANFALVNVITGEVIGDSNPRREVIQFFKNEFYSDNPEIEVKDLNESI